MLPDEQFLYEDKIIEILKQCQSFWEVLVVSMMTLQHQIKFNKMGSRPLDLCAYNEYLFGERIRKEGKRWNTRPGCYWSCWIQNNLTFPIFPLSMKDRTHLFLPTISGVTRRGHPGFEVDTSHEQEYGVAWLQNNIFNIRKLIEAVFQWRWHFDIEMKLPLDLITCSPPGRMLIWLNITPRTF